MDKIPKEYIRIKKILEVAVSSAVCEFNGGKAAVFYFYKRLGLVCGIHTISGCCKKDYHWMNAMGQKLTEKAKRRRKNLEA